MKKNNNVLLTVVVPVYNVEKYLDECIKSLINQSDNNFNIILVNDGSTDNSLKICEDYSEKFSRIKVISQENKGLGGARNTGLDLSETEYVTFLDSDDFWASNYVKKFEELLKLTGEKPDLIFTLPRCYDSVTNAYYSWKDSDLYNEIFEVNDGKSNKKVNVNINRKLYLLEVNANRKIYKTRFLKDNNFRFPEKLKWEDVCFNFQVLHRANLCMALPETGFYYRTNNSGQITAGGGKSRLDMITVFEDTMKMMNDEYFEPDEKAFVFNTILEFSKWSIDVCDIDTINNFLNLIHIFMNEIDFLIIKTYLDICSNNIIFDKNLIDCLMSDDYLILSDYVNREAQYSIWSNKRIKHGSLVKRGYDCLIEHGLIYTIKLSFLKMIKGDLK